MDYDRTTSMMADTRAIARCCGPKSLTLQVLVPSEKYGIRPDPIRTSQECYSDLDHIYIHIY